MPLPMPPQGLALVEWSLLKRWAHQVVLPLVLCTMMIGEEETQPRPGNVSQILDGKTDSAAEIAAKTAAEAVIGIGEGHLIAAKAVVAVGAGKGRGIATVRAVETHTGQAAAVIGMRMTIGKAAHSE